MNRQKAIIHILIPEIFSEFNINISLNCALENGMEISFTDAFSELIDKGGIFGAVLRGKMFDIGNAEMYRNSIKNY
jgi:UTP-glucose-1-phosphate uridylyltransferase